MLKRLWRDDHGAVISPELVLVGTILIIGVFAALTALRVALLTEVKDVSEAVHNFDFTPTLTPHDDDGNGNGNNGNPNPGLGPGHTHGNGFGPNHTHGNGHGFGHTHPPHGF